MDTIFIKLKNIKIIYYHFRGWVKVNFISEYYFTFKFYDLFLN
jgi:hypothetical protein